MFGDTQSTLLSQRVQLQSNFSLKIEENGHIGYIGKVAFCLWVA